MIRNSRYKALIKEIKKALKECDLRSAAELVEQALEEDPNQMEVYCLGAQIEFERNNYAKVIQHLQHAEFLGTLDSESKQMLTQAKALMEDQHLPRTAIRISEQEEKKKRRKQRRQRRSEREDDCCCDACIYCDCPCNCGGGSGGSSCCCEGGAGGGSCCDGICCCDCAL